MENGLFPGKLRALVLAPHTDDGEFGCGGTMARMVESKSEVYYVAFSSCDLSMPPELPPGTLREEARNAMQVLELPPENLILLNYPVRQFPLHRQEILEEMIRLKHELKPNIVFLPSRHDTHQDHQTVSQEGFRAFKDMSMLGYEVLWNNLTFPTNLFVLLEEKHLRRKIAALSCYQSQSDRPYANEQFVRSLAVTRGTQIAACYAEVFEAIRWVWR
jgi:LmbE family N-acetylglucosaminyl deacetylase